MSGADTEAIIAQVEKCPSGALSWLRNGEGREPSDEAGGETIV